MSSQVGQKLIHLHPVDSTSAFVCLDFLICGIQVVAPKNRVQQSLRPKIRIGARFPSEPRSLCNPFMGVHSCYLSLLRRYLLQVVFNMKLSVLSSMAGFHLELTPPTVQPFPWRLQPPGYYGFC